MRERDELAAAREAFRRSVVAFRTRPGAKRSRRYLINLRRSLEALSDEDASLVHAIRRPLTVDGVGRHPLGDLTLAVAADPLGGYGRASMWLGDQLGIDRAVLPATTEPTRRRLEELSPTPPAEAKGQPGRAVRRLRFEGGRTDSPEAAVAAIRNARWVLLTPGVVRTHPVNVRDARPRGCAHQHLGRVVWIANLEPDPRKAPGLTATDQRSRFICTAFASTPFCSIPRPRSHSMAPSWRQSAWSSGRGHFVVRPTLAHTTPSACVRR